MDYEKLYKERLEWAKNTLEYTKVSQEVRECIESLFPELKKSEHEKVKNFLIGYFSKLVDEKSEWGLSKDTRNRILDWLEKQEAHEETGSHGYIQMNKSYKCIASPRYSVFRIGEIYKPEDNFVCSLMNLCHECFVPIEGKEEQKPAEWSEEDESWFKELELMALSFSNDDSYRKKFFDWLKSIRSQNRWKPSDEQMKVIDLAIRCRINRGTREETTLVSLFNDLKKLREE